MNLSFKSTGKTSEMMRKVGLEADYRITQSDFASRLRHAIITIQYISDSYYMTLYCPDKHNVLHRKKLSAALYLQPRYAMRDSLRPF